MSGCLVCARVPPVAGLTGGRVHVALVPAGLAGSWLAVSLYRCGRYVWGSNSYVTACFMPLRRQLTGLPYSCLSSLPFTCRPPCSHLCSKLPTHHPEDRNTTAAAVSAAAAAMQAVVVAGSGNAAAAGGTAGTAAAPAIIDPKAQDLQFLFLAMTEEVGAARVLLACVLPLL